MRDPLHWMQVKHKLALAFAGLCFLAFGVGGGFVSHSARSALEQQIDARIDLQTRATARLLDDGLRLLRRRTEDFASDGYLRERTDELLSATSPEEAEARKEELRGHLAANKLPLVEQFRALSLVDADGALLVHVQGGGTELRLEDLAADVRTEGRRHSGLITSQGRAPVQVISTPLLRLDGTGPIGHLVAWVDSAAWVSRSLHHLQATVDAVQEQRTPTSLRIHDGAGNTLAVEAGPGGADAPAQVHVGVREPASEANTRVARFPIDENGWTVVVRMRAMDVFAPVSGLQSRFLGVGLVLAALCGVLLYFPMRFLVRPLGALREAAKQIRAGDYEARVDADSDDEVGDLARSFNHMAEAVQHQTRRLRDQADELRARQRELRTQNERLDTVLRSLRDGLVVLDDAGKPVLWNDAGRPLAEAFEAADARLGSHYVCRADTDAPSCATCLRGSVPAASRCVLDVGDRVYEVSGAALPPDADGARGTVLVARDVTERIEQDERDIHRERLSVLGEVAAVMAHELNNPLTSIRMFAQLMVDGLPTESPFREHADVIVRNTETCRHTIRELLGYATDSAPEAGPVSVHDVIEDVVQFVRPLAERAGARVVTELVAQRDVVNGDEIQIRQLFVNLILNAVQAAERDAVSITVSTRNEAGALLADVTDTGPGIPEDVRTRVFGAFFSTKPRGEGTGLGLPTARRIAELHGGGVELEESRPGKTTFRVRLRTASAVRPVAAEVSA